MLGAGDTKGYAGLFERAALQDDSPERYRGLVSLVELGLRAAGTAPPAQATELFLAIARALVDALSGQPAEPLLLNYAGVAFYELWSLDAARALFKAALRLDPALPHLRRNLAEVGKRMRDGRGPSARLRPLHTSLPALARRAKRAAAQAKPATGLTLSLCMIVRDEEEMLPRCLAAAAGAVDEIVIVDTGSTDRTIEIARSFGARVIEREWTGSFAEARNVSFEAATGDWLIYLDADEVLVAEDVERLRGLTGQTWREAFYLLETSYTGEDGDGTGMTHPALRVFRNRPGYRFEGRMHEQIAHRLPTQAPGRVEHTSIRVEHYGYLGSVRNAKEKSRRNIELLRAQQAEGQAGAFLRFNLGTEYATIGDHARALPEFERAWEIVKLQGEQGRDYVPSLLVRLVSALRACDRAQEAVSLTEEALQTFPGFTDLVFAQAVALRTLGREQEAQDAFERCLEMGDAPARYGATVGAGTYLPMLALAELALARGEVEAARDELERCVAAHPTFFGAVGPLATVLLQAGLDPDAVVAEIEERVAKATPTIRFMLATALHQHGALDAAGRQYRAVLESRPSASQVRVTLAELLLQRGDYAGAAELAGSVDVEDAFAALAARIELWATIAGRGQEHLGLAQARAREAGVSPAELDVFSRWAALSAGQPLDGPLAIGGTPLLGVILERLLALHEFETFELLLPALIGSELPRREQQELLGGLYLRYGFLQSAAREWLTVCESAPDSRAFVGLARVALAHGSEADAATFAAQALTLDGSSAPARELLEALSPRQDGAAAAVTT
ncbi:MAG TPA: glycosyltransferase [Solirubrobacteraceae bacterium]|nr:glycosyltransferase [Solirubrobacteraceae bacterium]